MIWAVLLLISLLIAGFVFVGRTGKRKDGGGIVVEGEEANNISKEPQEQVRGADQMTWMKVKIIFALPCC